MEKIEKKDLFGVRYLSAHFIWSNRTFVIINQASGLEWKSVFTFLSRILLELGSEKGDQLPPRMKRNTKGGDYIHHPV